MFRKVRRLAYQMSHPVMGVVLQLHRVTSLRSQFVENSAYEVTPEYFEEIILEYRRHHYEFISADGLYDILTGARRMKSKFVCLTFDDGYRDNFEVALPIMKRYGTPFIIFAATDNICGKSVQMSYILDDIISSNDIVELGDGSRFVCGGREEKQKAYTLLSSSLSRMSVPKVQELLADYVTDWYDKTSELMMDARMLRLMAREPLCTIGSHTVSHPHLSSLSEDRQRYEMSESKEILESIIGKEVTHFAFPYGDYSGVTSQLAKSLYKTTFAAWGGPLRLGCGCYCIPRIIVKQ